MIHTLSRIGLAAVVVETAGCRLWNDFSGLDAQPCFQNFRAATVDALRPSEYIGAVELCLGEDRDICFVTDSGGIADAALPCSTKREIIAAGGNGIQPSLALISGSRPTLWVLRESDAIGLALVLNADLQGAGSVGIRFYESGTDFALPGGWVLSDSMPDPVYFSDQGLPDLALAETSAFGVSVFTNVEEGPHKVWHGAPQGYTCISDYLPDDDDSVEVPVENGFVTMLGISCTPLDEQRSSDL